MVMTRAQWNKLQAKLPAEDRMSYEEYLTSQGISTAPATPVASREGGQIAAISMASQTSGTRVPVATSTPVVTPTPTPSPAPATSLASDPYYIRDPKTGLSPAQMEARAALEAAQTALTDVGVESKLLTSKTQAGRLVPKPADVPSDDKYDYTWKFMPEPGNLLGGSWKLVSTPHGKGSTTLLLEQLDGDGTPGNPYRYKKDGSLFNGNIGFGKYVNGVLVDPDTSTKEKPDTAAANKAAADALAAQQAAQAAAEEKRRQGASAYALLFSEFDRYGLGALVEPLKNLIVEGLSRDEFTLRLRETDAYKKRFAANQARIGKGLSALSEAEYINLEDQYQDVMRRYGLPETYYTRGDMGRQEGFERFIAGDVSPVELEDRVQTAQRRVLNAAPQIKNALTQYYGDEISNGDILAYVLDPDKAIENIKRKVTAAEIGGAATMAGLGAGRTRAEELQRFGVTGEQARQGFTTISEFLPQAQVLGERYAKQGMGPFTQETAEQEVFAIPGAAEAGRKRRKLAELEVAQFSSQTGVTGGALARERAGQF